MAGGDPKPKQLVTFYRDGDDMHTPTALTLELDVTDQEFREILTRAAAAVPPSQFTVGSVEVQVLAGTPPEVADEGREAVRYGATRGP
jgi:hypothetical protein